VTDTHCRKHIFDKVSLKNREEEEEEEEEWGGTGKRKAKTHQCPSYVSLSTSPGQQ
jgi:hypothetical protein